MKLNSMLIKSVMLRNVTVTCSDVIVGEIRNPVWSHFCVPNFPLTITAVLKSALELEFESK